MAVELDPTVLPVMHKKARPVRHSLLVRMLGGLFLGFAALLCFWLFVLPVLVVALSSVASHWSGTILPDGFSMRWFERLGSSDFDALTTSLEVGMGVAVLGTVTRAVACARARRARPARPRRNRRHYRDDAQRRAERGARAGGADRVSQAAD